MWACVDAQLAEHTVSEVILIVCEQFLFLSVGSGDSLRHDFYGAVRACLFAERACYALVLAVGVVRHDECSAVPLGDVLRLAVLGILLSYFRRDIFSHGDVHACKQCLYSVKRCSEI